MKVTKTHFGLINILLLIVAMFLAGGGFPFLRRPMGLPLLVLWALWWGSIAVLPESHWERDRLPPTIRALNSLALLILIMAPPWEYSRFSGPIPRDTFISCLGPFFFGIGILLQTSSLKSHIRYGPNVLVTDGPYRFFRHPIYLGNMLCFIGVTIATSSLLAALSSAWLSGVMLWQIPQEEKSLTESFGEAYTHYCQRTKRLLPRVY